MTEDRLTGRRAGLVWLVVGASVAVMLAGLVGGRPEQDSPAILGAVLVLLIPSLGIVGALIATRRPGNPIGWILWTPALVLTLGMAIGTYLSASISASDSDQVSAWLGWLLGLLFTPVIGALLLIVPLLFPDGHLLSPRWRWVVWLGVAVGVAAVLPTPSSKDRSITIGVAILRNWLYESDRIISRSLSYAEDLGQAVRSALRPPTFGLGVRAVAGDGK